MGSGGAGGRGCLGDCLVKLVLLGLLVAAAALYFGAQMSRPG